MPDIKVELEDLIAVRAEKNTTLYMEEIPGKSRVKFVIQAENNIALFSEVNKHHPLASQLAPYGNVPIIMRDKRITSHDFTDSASWTAVDNSAFKVEADAGHKLIVTSIQVRFPKELQLLDTNKLYFTVYVWIEAYQSVVPAISLQYSSVRDLVKRSNNPLLIPPSAVTDLGTEELVEMEFKYADPFTLEGCPIILSKDKGEYIEMGLTGHTPLLRADSTAYGTDNETWCVTNARQVIDF